jgi:hypothetical protein
MASIQRELRQKGIFHHWETIRTRLSTQTRVTASLTNDKGERVHIRQTTPFHDERKVVIRTEDIVRIEEAAKLLEKEPIRLKFLKKVLVA